MWQATKRLALGAILIVLASAVLLLSDSSRQRSDSRSRTVHVAILQHASQPVMDDGVAGMVEGLAEGGYAEGNNLVLARYNAEGDLPTANTIAKEMTGAGHDLVMTASTLSLQAVANANTAGKVRHVFALVSDPAAAGVGIVRDKPLEHPPHLAGYGTMQPVEATFRLAKKIYPGLKVVGEVWNPAEANSEAQTKVARAVCRELDIELLEANAENASAVVEAAGSLLARGVEALWVGGDVTVMAALDGLIPLAKKARLPVFSSMPGAPGRGTLFDLGADYHEVGRLAGRLAAEILAGRDPASVPIENVLPERLVVDETLVAGLDDPWRFPDEVLARVAAERDKAQAAASAAAASVAARAGAPAPLAKTWKIDLLEFITVVDVEEGEHGMRDGFREAGLVEGRDYVLRIRNAQGDMPTLSALVDAALTDGTELMLTMSTPTLQAAIQRTKRIPIVFTFVANAVAAGAAKSNEDHLPNVTGVPTVGAYDDLLKVVRETMPDVKRIGTLFVPAEVNSVVNKDELTRLAKEHGIEVVGVAANTATEIADAALSLANEDIDAVVQVAGNLTSAAFVSITQATRRAKIPLFGALSSNAVDGAQVTMARDYYEGGREAALMAARIMRGENPATIPLQPLRSSKLLVNEEAARAIGMRIPASVVSRAIKVGAAGAPAAGKAVGAAATPANGAAPTKGAAPTNGAGAAPAAAAGSK